jgi:hypothetical protein
MKLLIVLCFQAVLTYYDPSLCHTQPINCYNPETWWNMAAGHDARDNYGNALACPQEFPIGSRWELPRVTNYPPKTWRCLDRGGLVKTTVDYDGNITVILDLLVREPIESKTVDVCVRTNNLDRLFDFAGRY